jgi:hypothetical protein
MRRLNVVALVTLLAACGDDDKPPTAPTPGDTPAADAAVAELATTTPGVTRAFYVDGFPTGGFAFIGTSFTQIQVFASLPAGKYIATATAVLAASDPEDRLVDCMFTINGMLKGGLIRGVLVGAPTNHYLSLPITFGFSSSAPVDLGVACRSDVARVVVSQPGPLTAIKVDQLTTRIR